MKKLIIGVLVIALLALGIWLWRDGNVEQLPEEEPEGDVIENEAYYQEKVQEFEGAEDEYDELLTAYIAEKFSEEDKQVLQDYNQKMSEAVAHGSKEEKLKFSHEKTAYIEKVSAEKFTKEQLQKLEEIQKKIDELEPIVDEYVEKQIVVEEKKFWEGRETLKDGSILNVRESITSDKECEGLKFSNIGLRYVPDKKCTYFSATVTNTTQQMKEEGKVSVKITGDCETIFPLILRELEPGESYEFEIEYKDDISMAGTLEIVPYDEKDYADIVPQQ